MSSFYIITYDPSKMRYEAKIKGLLTTTCDIIIPNPFNFGKDIEESEKFRLVVDEEESTQGVIRDFVMVRIQNDELLVLVSPRAITILTTLSEKFSFHQLEILSEEITINDYSILNVRPVINCINHQKSRLIYWDETQQEVYNINQLVLDETKIPEAEMAFLLGEIRGSVIAFHKSVKDELEKERISGLQFSQPSEFVL